ncbi:hypothetical protein [Streptomyces kronopolitis]|uniref:hypothetical protein n=1 Tax=Streptomyces kronopolitis TaxID=1612435 RepID=UPI0034191182
MLLLGGGLSCPGAPQQRVEGLGESGFGLFGVLPDPLGDGAQVLPGVVIERLVGVVAVDPRDLGEPESGQAAPDVADVVGVVVDLPFPTAPAARGWLLRVAQPHRHRIRQVPQAAVLISLEDGQTMALAGLYESGAPRRRRRRRAGSVVADLAIITTEATDAAGTSIPACP